jgi:hypothetical protein
MPYSSHPPWLDHSNYIWRRVQAMKLLIHIFYNSLFVSHLTIRRCIAGVPNLLNIGAAYENNHSFRSHK